MARNILVVEDDPHISDLLRMYLEKEGFQVLLAADGGQGLEMFRQTPPDLVLLDLMLPVMDGWAVCARIRETSKVPIIMLTAKSDVTDRITGLEMGADDYVGKPVKPRVLLARIRALLRRASSAAEGEDGASDEEPVRLQFNDLVVDRSMRSEEHTSELQSH